MEGLLGSLPLILMFVLFYFLLIQTKPKASKGCSNNAKQFAKRGQDRYDRWTSRYN